MAQTKAQLIDGKGAVDLGAFSISGSAPDNSVNLDASGRLLVGTSSDTSAGEASALIQTAYSTGSLMSVGRSDTTVTNNEFIGGIDFVTQSGTGSTWQRSARILCYADADQGNGDSPGRLTFSTTADGASSPTEAMRITNDRRLIVNGLSAAGVFHIIDSGDKQGVFALQVNNSNSNNGQPTRGLQIRYPNVTPNDTNNAIELNVSIGVPFVVRNNGNVQNTNGSFTSLSDAKFKENIVDSSSQWDDLKAIKIRNWNFKEETGYQTHRQIGPIAQELETVCPGLVLNVPDRNENGDETGEITKGVNQSVLYMKAVKALQEAMERIEQLEATNADLLARVTALESA